MQWYMSDYEIKESYRTARDKRNQIIVLADLNCVTPKQMITKLVELGLVKQGTHVRRRPAQNPSIKRNALPQSETARRMELYNRGASDMEIAAACGLTKTGIAYWRKRLNIPPNNPRK